MLHRAPVTTSGGPCPARAQCPARVLAELSIGELSLKDYPQINLQFNCGPPLINSTKSSQTYTDIKRADERPITVSWSRPRCSPSCTLRLCWVHLVTHTPKSAVAATPCRRRPSQDVGRVKASALMPFGKGNTASKKNGRLSLDRRQRLERELAAGCGVGGGSTDAQQAVARARRKTTGRQCMS